MKNFKIIIYTILCVCISNQVMAFQKLNDNEIDELLNIAYLKTDNYNLHKMHRWNTEIPVGLKEMEDSDFEEFKEIIKKFNSVNGLNINIAHKKKASFVIVYDSKIYPISLGKYWDLFKKFIPNGQEKSAANLVFQNSVLGNPCFSYQMLDGSGSILGSILFIDSTQEKNVRMRCIQREGMRSLGLVGFPHKDIGSIFDMSNTVFNMTEIDMSFLSHIYDPAIPVGASPDILIRHIKGK